MAKQLYTDGNYLVIEESVLITDPVDVAYQYPMQFTYYREIWGLDHLGVPDITGFELLNSASGGEYYISEAEVKAGSIYNKANDPFTREGFITFLRESTSLTPTLGQSISNPEEKSAPKIAHIKVISEG